MIFGYIRSSKGAASAADQMQALQAANCDKLIEEEVGKKDLPELRRMVEASRPGDVLAVTSLDRLAPSMLELLTDLAELSGRGIEVLSLKEQLDTRRFSDSGNELSKLLRSIVSSERRFLVERIQEGRASAVRKGVKLGRRSKLSADQVAHARSLIDLGEGGRAVARTFSVSEATLYRALRLHPRGI